MGQSSELRSQSHNSKVKTGLRERCYSFSVTAVKFIEVLPEQRAHRILSDQLLRSATSIGAKIYEAKAAISKRDFMKYYEIALKSANETTYRLQLMGDTLVSKAPQTVDLSREAAELTRIIAASLLTMKDKR